MKENKKEMAKKIIDISMPLDEKTPAYPEDPPLGITQIADINKEGWNEKRLELNSHCGTHVDAPAHMIPDGKTLNELSLDHFYGPGVVIDVREKEINLSCLTTVKIPRQSIVLFLTGQSEKKMEEYYEQAKLIPEQVAEKLAEMDIKAIGIDSFSPDMKPFPVHKILLSKDICIIENLTNLQQLIGKEFVIHFFPLAIAQGDGAPCRAVAFMN